ncbi:patatin-like phospholipase family protein [Actinomadura macrotermitis]|uniref:PNPLA domain-containing protein n=1 Tax=Actinomadura macrotermitis TaxID=2585200 RepID=A0A7K0C2K1_9ACTN|nr:patatin-like phospholipase family protein [Actinomadura macrotermitis]MQY07653.1 hypothetical protein [Actinomadura macrotermitis]
MASGPIAFVLSGGGKMASTELGMLAALTEAGIHPDLVLGSSAGAMIGAVFADRAGRADTTGLDAVYECWTEILTARPLRWSVPHGLYRLVSPAARARARECLRTILERHIGARTFEELGVRFECNALQLNTMSEHWFGSGPLVPAVLAAGAAPAILSHTRVDGKVYLDGGFLDPVPLDRALQLGARTVYVLQASDFAHARRFPRALWEAGIAEGTFRIMFSSLLDNLPEGTEVHLLPIGRRNTPHGVNMIRQIYGFDAGRARDEGERYMEAAYRATAAYLRFESQTGRSARKRTGPRRPGP